MKHPSIVHAQRQSGAFVLIIGMIVLILATIVTIYGARVSLVEQRISGNEYRSKKAFEAASAGADYAQMYLDRNMGFINQWTWSACYDSNGNLTPPATWNDELDSLCGVQADNLMWSELPAGNLMQPDDTTTAYRAHYLTPDDDGNGLPAADNTRLTIVSEGGVDIPGSGARTIENGTGYAMINVTIKGTPLLPGPPSFPPLSASGTVQGGGNLTIVPNPDAGAEGAVLSVWSNADVTLSGSASMTTCTLDTFLNNPGGNAAPYIYNPASPLDTSNVYDRSSITNEVVICDSCICPNPGQADADETVYTYRTGNDSTEGVDILDNDADAQANSINFPGGNDTDTDGIPGLSATEKSLFNYVFGFPINQYDLVKANATVIPDCSGLNANSSGFYWVRDEVAGVGNCQLNGNTQIGSPFDPVLIVVDDGELRINGNTIFGMIFLFDNPDNGNPPGRVQFSGNPVIYGSVIVNDNIDLGNGAVKFVYQDIVVKNLAANLQKLGRVVGTWADFAP